MAFTYLSTAPASSDRSFIRLLIGDTNIASYQLEDEEIDAFSGVYGNNYLTAAFLADSLGAKNATKVDKSVSKLRISSNQTSKQYYDLAKRLRYQAISRATPYAGGISKADVASVESDSDRVQPLFKVGQFNNPDAALNDASTAVF